jgi:hypothetical protein
MSCKISSSGLQFVQWYELRKLYGDEYWKEPCWDESMEKHICRRPRAPWAGAWWGRRKLVRMAAPPRT